MTHRHEWIMNGDYSGGTWAICKICKYEAFMDIPEIERRLNATEALTAEMAITVAEFIHSEMGYRFRPDNDELERQLSFQEDYDALIEYASILEGKDDVA